MGVSSKGEIEQVIQLPASTTAHQARFGFEGVTSTGDVNHEILYVAFQREWANDHAGFVRIGHYEVIRNKWSLHAII